MPKVPVDYSQTCIYKLVHFDDLNDENIYVGHTTNMVKRRHKHKQSSCNPNNKEYNQKKYQYIRDNGGWDNWRMILVEKYPCNDIDEALVRERYWVKELKTTLNQNEPCRTKQEYYLDNKEKISEYKKEYRDNNKEKIAEKKKEWQEANKEQISERRKEYRENNKEKIIKQKKEYYENNKETISEKQKEYYLDNKEKISEYKKEYRDNNKETIIEKKKEYRENNKEKLKEKATCDCGSVVRKDSMSRHLKTIKHKEWEKNML